MGVLKVDLSQKKLCIIGAGPAALSMIYQLRKKSNLGEPIPLVVCYDKADAIGGNWNFNPSVGKCILHTTRSILNTNIVHSTESSIRPLGLLFAWWTNAEKKNQKTQPLCWCQRGYRKDKKGYSLWLRQDQMGRGWWWRDGKKRHQWPKWTLKLLFMFFIGIFYVFGIWDPIVQSLEKLHFPHFPTISETLRFQTILLVWAYH